MRDLTLPELEIVSGGEDGGTRLPTVHVTGTHPTGHEFRDYPRGGGNSFGPAQPSFHGPVGFGGSFEFEVPNTSPNTAGNEATEHCNSADNTGFYGGGWFALLAGASVSGGGGASHGSAGGGLGGGLFFGYSSDSGFAENQAEISQFQGGLGLVNTGLVFDLSPFSIGLGVGAAAMYP